MRKYDRIRDQKEILHNLYIESELLFSKSERIRLGRRTSNRRSNDSPRKWDDYQTRRSNMHYLEHGQEGESSGNVCS